MTDVQEKRLNLKVATLRVINDGEVDIVQSLYEETGIWGVKVDTGKIIEARLVNAASDYIKENIKVRKADNSSVSFEKIIFERGKYFDLELLLLHQKDAKIHFTAIGKIAGIELIPIRTIAKIESGSFWEELISGNYLVHIIRALVYFLIAIAIIFMIVLPADRYSEWKEERIKNRRKGMLKDVLLVDVEDKNDEFHKLYKGYIHGGKKYLEKLKNILEDKERLKEYMQEYLIQDECNEKLAEISERTAKRLKPSKDVSMIYNGDMVEHRLPHYIKYDYWFSLQKIIGNLMDENLIRLEDGKVFIDPELEPLIEKLEQYENEI